MQDEPGSYAKIEFGSKPKMNDGEEPGFFNMGLGAACHLFECFGCMP